MSFNYAENGHGLQYPIKRIPTICKPKPQISHYLTYVIVIASIELSKLGKWSENSNSARDRRPMIHAQGENSLHDDYTLSDTPMS
ncbi:hypothetical protein TNCV_196771 [Trichonephila clavipes]|uniref:Uncharacterized protein n=1 Tax=Trichonephila clavipes TaxID=2585209 RepID=A0A8X6WJC3_TRICX|nr:hypothetical protein TNCV_196771 [Trichonephila clavipes]